MTADCTSYDTAYDSYNASISDKLAHDPAFDTGGRWIVKPVEGGLTTATLGEAHLITSMPHGGDGTHALPVLDLDFPCRLIPSSTEGHFHLYLDKEVPIDHYWKVLEVLAEAGLVEDGYVSASEARGFTAARLPWIKKATTTTEEEA